MASALHSLSLMWKHWAIRTCTPYQPFKDFEIASWTWHKLRHLFPDALAAVLMPNHFHLIIPHQKPPRPLYGILGKISERLEISRLWQPISPPSLIPDHQHLRRHIRYVALNPCRADLCSDPLEWTWSTYRDLLGASAVPWTNTQEVVRALKDYNKNFAVRFHSYVSGDPSVSLEGSPPPQRSIPKQWAEHAIAEILAASAAALRTHKSEVKKRSELRILFVQMAFRHGWRDPLLLAQICGISRRAVNLILKKEDHYGISAADLCLGDPRLNKTMEPLTQPRSIRGSIQIAEEMDL